ncbi:MAG TPA: hypothetical protein VEG38_10820 [Acidimicrobiia bacterium]|nr:hypothetical protein [Acidimicrobiia bacterium]
MATKRLFPVLAVTLAVGAGCASSAAQNEAPRLAADVAAGLATRAEQVAAALDAGQCDQALEGARSLQNDITALPADPAVRAEALAGAARLANGISCPPPVVATATSVPVLTAPDLAELEKLFEGKQGKGRKGKGDDD